MQSFKDFCGVHILKMDTLTNFDLIGYAKELGLKNFKGVFIKDELNKRIGKNECGIVNLQNSNQDGSHWTCYYKNKTEKYYFDSYGLDPPNQLLEYLKPTKNSTPLIISTYQI